MAEDGGLGRPVQLVEAPVDRAHPDGPGSVRGDVRDAVAYAVRAENRHGLGRAVVVEDGAAVGLEPETCLGLRIRHQPRGDLIRLGVRVRVRPLRDARDGPGLGVEAVQPGLGPDPDGARAVGVRRDHEVGAESLGVARTVAVGGGPARRGVEAVEAAVGADPDRAVLALGEVVDGVAAQAGGVGGVVAVARPAVGLGVVAVEARERAHPDAAARVDEDGVGVEDGRRERKAPPRDAAGDVRAERCRVVRVVVVARERGLGVRLGERRVEAVDAVVVVHAPEVPPRVGAEQHQGVDGKRDRRLGEVQQERHEVSGGAVVAGEAALDADPEVAAGRVDHPADHSPPGDGAGVVGVGREDGHLGAVVAGEPVLGREPHEPEAVLVHRDHAVLGQPLRQPERLPPREVGRGGRRPLGLDALRPHRLLGGGRQPTANRHEHDRQDECGGHRVSAREQSHGRHRQSKAIDTDGVPRRLPHARPHAVTGETATARRKLHDRPLPMTAPLAARRAGGGLGRSGPAHSASRASIRRRISTVASRRVPSVTRRKWPFTQRSSTKFSNRTSARRTP